MRVLRDSTNDLLKVDENYFSLSQIVDRVYEIVSKHSSNPGFDMPPWFYSGSPYADEILNIGIEPLKLKPKEFQPEFLPQSNNKNWKAKQPLWTKIFNCEEKLNEL
jgi:hypothetical protein